MGVDGEGVRGHTPEEPNHHYILLAAVSRDGRRRYSVENPAGLSTVECLRFLVSLPKSRTRLFGYSLNYDWTKILADLDDQRLYLLFRPELRKRRTRKRVGKLRRADGPKAIEWQGFTLSLQGTKFTIGYQRYTPAGYVLDKREIWDIWKFYQSKFVTGLQDWKVGSDALYKRMTAMKNRRATFKADELPEIRRYCFEECACMGELAHKLVEAHETAGLKLTSFYGAGSTATALLKKLNVRPKLRPAIAEMALAVSQAFFGGRFEHSVTGEYSPAAFNYDISSAYPYQCCFLPCLIHGGWRLVSNRKDIEGKRAALVHYALRDLPEHRRPQDWAPFPYREEDGSICFPAASPGGWVWGEEYLAGEAAFPDLVEFREAWVLENDCDCQPFKDVPHYYRERIRIGKEGPGIVYKLGLNSIYGKTAQSVGNAIFANWMYAGMITSGCRAQALRLFPIVKDLSDILMVATDGLVLKKRIATPKPRDTGTFDCRKEEKDGSVKYVPLGGWEESQMKRGVFLARPGIYFPTNPTDDDIKKIKGRGVGNSVVLNNHKMISESWRQSGDRASVNVHGVERFCGAKTSVSYSPGRGEFTRAAAGWEPAVFSGSRWTEARRAAPSYGEWTQRVVTMSFDPLPKRARVLKDTGQGFSTLSLRVIPLWMPESMPYKKAVLSAEAAAMKAAMAEIEEQPDADYIDGFGEEAAGIFDMG